MHQSDAHFVPRRAGSLAQLVLDAENMETLSEELAKLSLHQLSLLLDAAALRAFAVQSKVRPVKDAVSH